MINKLRFRFIQVTMAAVLTVLVLIITTINVINISQNTRSLDGITERLIENRISMMEKFDPPRLPAFAFSGFNKGLPFPFQNEKELPYSTRFFSIRVDGDGRIIRYNLKQIASVSEGDLEGIKADILGKNSAIGWYHNFRYRVSKKTEDGCLMILLESTSTLSSMGYVLVITLTVGAASFALLFLLIAIFSKRAIRPITTAYDKQKQFITDASHELKTPLTVISANAEILSLSYGENEWCDGIARQTDTMRALIGQMIQMARLDENDTTPEVERFSLSDAVYDTAMSFETPASRRGLHLSVETEPEISIVGNEASVRQVVAILMDNAVKYCDAGGEIQVTLRSAGRKGRVLLTVSNSCAEIDTLDTQRLFDRFYRKDEARKQANSFGLGLSIAKSIMEQHKGDLICRKGEERQIRFIATFRR